MNCMGMLLKTNNPMLMLSGHRLLGLRYFKHQLAHAKTPRFAGCRSMNIKHAILGPIFNICNFEDIVFYADLQKEVTVLLNSYIIQ